MYKRGNWYTNTIFISLLFAFWFLVVPLIVGLVLLKKQRELANANHGFFLELEEQIKKLKKENEIDHTTFLKKEREMLINELNGKLKLVSKLKSTEGSLAHYKELMSTQIHVLENKERKSLIGIFRNYLALIRNIKEKEKEILVLDQAIENRKKRLNRISRKKHVELYELKKRINRAKNKLLFWDDEILLQDHALYSDRFNFVNASLYKEKLDEIRAGQKELIKFKQATIHNSNWNINGNKRKGNTQNNKNIRLTLIAFNQQCDNIINKVRYNNVAVCERQMYKAFNDINYLNKYNIITIADEYFKLKLDELYLSYEYSKQLQAEKEEQERIKDLMREEKRVQKELNEQLAKLNKEEKHLKIALQQDITKLDEVEKYKLERRLEEIKKQKEEVDYRVKNERAGYVYITSNIGSFGENIYKIGMTRRLEPMDRIKELSGAAVPFQFDVHAFIFSEDAPALEATLHKTFHLRRLNKVNQRKEFFKVTLHEIERVVHQNHNAKIEFTKLAEAREYRETVKKQRTIA